MGNLKLDPAGIAEAINSAAVIAEVEAQAQRVAGNVNYVSHDGPVPVEVKVRPLIGRFPGRGADVTITHPSGLPAEAKYGVLTRAVGGA